MATSKQVNDFIIKIAPLCMEDMKKTGVLASLSIVQACVESAYGQSTATIMGNNLFGIKADKYWKGEFVIATGWEEKNGVKLPKQPMKWRKYNSWQESIDDHSTFLKAKRYANIIGCTDYKQACINIRKDGYCTSDTYTQLLISIIESHQLYKYDQQVLSGLPIVTPIPSSPTQQASTIKHNKLTIANGKWNVRIQPNVSSNVKCIVDGGQTYVSSKAVGDWYFIDNLNGYIASKGVTNVTPIISNNQAFVMYTIKPNDSWWKIAQEQMGNGAKCEDLAKFNGMTTKTVIKPNQQIKIPK